MPGHYFGRRAASHRAPRDQSLGNRWRNANARNIQRIVRGWLARKHVARMIIERHAAEVIQAITRGRIVRRGIRHRFRARWERVRAATTIVAISKGLRSRMRTRIALQRHREQRCDAARARVHPHPASRAGGNVSWRQRPAPPCCAPRLPAPFS